MRYVMMFSVVLIGSNAYCLGGDMNQGNTSSVSGVFASSGSNSDITQLNSLTTITSAFTETSSMTNTSSGGILVKSSVTASAFFGDGSHLTGVTSTPSNTVTSSFTVSNTAGLLVVGGSVTASAYFGDGSHLTGVSSTPPEYNTTTKGFSLANTFASSVTISSPLLINTTTPSRAAVSITSGVYSFDFYGASVAATALSGGSAPVFQGRVYNGSLASPTAILDATVMGIFSATGFDGTSFPTEGNTPGSLQWLSSGTYSGSSHGSYFSLFTTPIGSTTRQMRMRVDDAGNVGIGTGTMTTKLDVNGTSTFRGNMNFPLLSTITASVGISISTPGATVPGISLGTDNRARYLVGASTQISYAPLLLFSFAGTSATLANSVSQVLQEYTMPGNVLRNNGDSIYVICQGTGTASSVTRMLIPSLGGTETNIAVAGSAGVNRGEARLTRIAAASQFYEGLSYIRTGFNIQDGVLTLDETLPIAIQCVGKSSGATGGDVVLKSMKVIYEPANPAP